MILNKNKDFCDNPWWSIAPIFKEELIVYKQVCIAEQEGHEQVGAFRACLHGPSGL